MTQATPYPYLRPPIKVENTDTHEKPNVLKWAGYSCALGILSYYAPKTFLAASVGIVVYQIHCFNQLVHSAESSKHQEIRAWTINACQVISSTGIVLGFQSIPWLMSSFKAARHFQLFRSGAYSTVGILFIAAGWGCLLPFGSTAGKLSAKRHWVEMEDYVEKYPPYVKENYSSIFISKIAFFIAAIIPQTGFARKLSSLDMVLSQFSSPQVKFDRLKAYLSNPKLCSSIPEKSGDHDWGHAIHLFQTLPIEDQLALGPELTKIANASTPEQRDQLPAEVKLVLLNEQLKRFEKIPAYGDDNRGQWNLAFTQFTNSDAVQQAALGGELLRLIQKSDVRKVSSLPIDIKVAALRHCLKLLAKVSTPENWKSASQLIEELPLDERPMMLKQIGSELATVTANFTQKQIDELSVPIRVILLGHHLTSFKGIPPSDTERFPTWKMIAATYEKLPQFIGALTDELKRLAKASDQERINALPSPLKERLTQLKNATS